MIDTLRYTRELEGAGLTREQAELFVRSHLQMISDNVATKADIKELDHKFEAKIDQLDAKFETKIDQLDAKFSIELHKMVNKLGITVVASVSALGVFISGFGIFLKFF